VADIAAQPLHNTAEACPARGAPVLPVITDVSDPAAVTTLACRTLEEFGRVELTINNAGISVGGGQPLPTSLGRCRSSRACRLLAEMGGERRICRQNGCAETICASFCSPG
jgi:NAD(P)-dependent dehydrogenase (short-subunit alcohol dehydrogenase family)